MLDPYIEAHELRELILKKEVRPREVAQFFIERTQKLNPKLGAFMTITPERAIADADRIEKMSETERNRALMFGVPYSIKDLNWTKDIPTSMGSKNYEKFIAPADDEIVVRMRNAGGILLGKTTTPEFGGRPTTEGGLCPPARNPWNLEHTAGGSSGGAGSALGAGLGAMAQGSDGGGSIRIPSACCGVVGIKPSRGRISMSPQAGEAWAGFATFGPMARSVRDVATMLDVMHGPVVGDPYWAPEPITSFKAAVDISPRHCRIGMITKTSMTKVDAETIAALESAAKVFEDMGHRIEPIACDPGARLREVVMALICAGVGSVPVTDIKLVDPVVRGLWEAGQKMSATEYITTVTQMHNLSREIVQELAPYDAVISPVTSSPAVKLGTLPSHPSKYQSELIEWIPFTFPFNATGQPAFSVPNGMSKAGLPLAMQIVGRQCDEVTIIGLAAQFEKARPWKGQHPKLD
ncbi:MAG TPA: amidase [Candidatus Acidoferrales bacterium]|nr:amidase [Candidatus Acidoferrales bacterium]